MVGVNGLLAKMLILVMVVAVLSLGGSYTFVNIQQKQAFEDNIAELKDSHKTSASLLLDQHLQEQVLAAEEIVMLSGVREQSAANLDEFFAELWPHVQLSYSLSSLAFANEDKIVEFGQFPVDDMRAMKAKAASTLRPQSGIVCHMLCELGASIPITIDNEQWSLSLLTDIAPTIIFLNSVVNSDIGIVAPSQAPSDSNKTLSRYVVEVITGAERNSELFAIEMNEAQIQRLETKGLKLSTKTSDYFVWFESIEDAGQNIELLFIRDISALLTEQNNQKQQVIVIFVSLTLGVLLFLILFSIIPISRLNQLKRAIQLIGAKDYNVARFRLGKPSKSMFKDELDDLEDEFRNAIDVLETYEHQLKASQKRLVRQATVDATTGLFTRNVLIEDLSKMQGSHDIQEVAIFFLDLDGFKPVNDNLGHEAGDIMLKKIGYRLKGLVNKRTKVYRIGGDEFVISFCNFNDMQALKHMADAVVELFNAPFNIYDTSIVISASIGITSQQTTQINADELLRFADIAMYQAKERGKNRYEFFDDSMRDAAQRRFIIKNDFVASLADNQLFVVFQPIVSSHSRSVIKLESLCRWHHPELGFIPPPIFIDVLEETENMNSLFAWIVDNVIKEIKYLDSIGRDDIIISVNLSTSQLVNIDSLTVLKDKIERYNVEPSRIELEITETSLIANFAQAKAWVEDASDFGFKIAIDDFGAGYSSLSYLTAFPYHTVKLDRSLLNKIEKDNTQQRIVGSLTQMLHSLSVPIVAEGAETEQQFEQLKQLGCDCIQGYLISKPIPHVELVHFLDQYQYNTQSKLIASPLR